jgi:ferritin-like protein
MSFRAWLLGPVLQLLKEILTVATITKEEVEAVSTQVAKIGTETTITLQKVADLEAALANGIPQDVADAFAALKAQVQVVDDLIPDA